MTGSGDLVVFVDDDAEVRAANQESLELADIRVLAFDSATRALGAIHGDFPGVIVTDIQMPDIDGLAFYQRLQEIDPELPVIFITGHGDIDQAVSALQAGAYDFLAKPFSAARLVRSVQRANEKRRLVLENRQLRADAALAQTGWPIMGVSDSVENLRGVLRRLATADVDTIIEGETGVGKELAARALHLWGPRREHRFVALNCGALPAEHLESELFGHELGAFSGAVRSRVGLLEHAHRGTLFLDEIESLPASSQVKLLRALAEREVTRLGSNEVRPIDVKIVAATKLDLRTATGPLRPDLVHRLDVGRVRVPTLRERRSDIPLLFAHFVAHAADRRKSSPPPIDNATRAYLTRHDWPGNIRELANFAERFALGLVESEPEASTEAAGLRSRVDEFEAELIREALAGVQGRVADAIDRLQIPRKTFYDKVQKHGIDLNAFRHHRSPPEDAS